MDMGKEKQMERDRGLKKASLFITSLFIIRPLQSQEQDISYLCLLFTTEPHSCTECMKQPRPSHTQHLRKYGLSILRFASSRDILSWSRICIFYIYHTRMQHKIEARTKDQANYTYCTAPLTSENTSLYLHQ